MDASVPKLGIAVITYNRFERARQVVGRLIEMTSAPFTMVVAEDGGSDDTASYFKQLGLTVVTGENHGVCWNKNRGLFALLAAGCTTILIMEDDIYPARSGWEDDWIAATEAFDHVAFAHSKIAPQIVSGAGTPLDPFVNYKATAQCSSISQKALQTVGFLDSRFIGYGVGHAEWTSRIKAAGLGFKRITLPTGEKARGNLYIEGGLIADDAATFRDRDTVEKNKLLFKQLKAEPLFRKPWSTPEQRSIFLAEQAAAGVNLSGSHLESFLASDTAS